MSENGKTSQTFEKGGKQLPKVKEFIENRTIKFKFARFRMGMI